MWRPILFNPFILLLIYSILFTGIVPFILLTELTSSILFDGSEDAHKLLKSFDLNSFDGKFPQFFVAMCNFK
jgi:hypothetical protein